MRPPVDLPSVRQCVVAMQVCAVRALLCACLVVLGTGCYERTFHSADALEAYLEGQRESSVVERGAYRLQLQRMPSARLLLGEYREAEAFLTQVAEPYRSQAADSLERQIALRGRELASMANFSLAVERVDGRDLVYASLQSEGYEAYSEWIQELLFGLGEHLELKNGDGMTLDPIALHMERTYGTLSSRTFFLSFEVPDSLSVAGWEEGAFVQLAEFGLRTGRLQLPVPPGNPAVTLRLQ